MLKTSEKARILLLNPPTAGVSTVILLNLAYLASSLRMNGHEVKIIDATAPHKLVKPSEIEEIIAEFKPHFIGVTLTITYIPQTYLYLKSLRKIGIPIIAGGPHANCMPEEVLENGSDIVVIGEGEETIVELAEHFIGDKPLIEIAGLCFKDKSGKSVYTTPRNLIANLDTIPFPDFKDFPIENYTGSKDVNSNPIFWSIFSSRGCPFDCLFCSSHNVFGRVMRMRSAQNVFEEIKGLVNNFGAEKITFQDDEILSSKKRFIELCDLITDSKLKVKLSIRTRIDSIDEEILTRAKEMGLTRISFGIESWNDDTLKKINKKYDVKTIRESFKCIEKSNFPFISFTNIIGFPWETRQHLQDNVNEIAKINSSIPYFTAVVTPIPYPKTKLYELYHKEYGFTKWWLDTKKNFPREDVKNKPFFMHFAIRIPSLYKPDVYWNYSRKKQKLVEQISWKIFDLFIKRHLKNHEYMLVLPLCRVSYFLWKISPKLELAVFDNPLISKKVLNLIDKIMFTSKY